MKRTIRLTESDLHKVIKESVKRILREDLEGQELADYVDSLHLNDNVPSETGIFKGDGEMYYGWGKGNSPYYKYDAFGRRVNPSDPDAPWTDDNGQVHYHPQDPKSDIMNTYRTNARHTYQHGEGPFIRDDRHAARNYVNTGKAQGYDYYWGTNEYDSYPAEDDLKALNDKQAKSDRDNMDRALKAADKRPLHRKGSLNRK